MYVELVKTFSRPPTHLRSCQALSTGRPPVFNRAFVDCKFPQDEDLPTNLEPGDVSSSKSGSDISPLPRLTRDVVGVWMYRFGFEGISEIIARTLTAAPPRYSTIKELDRKIHEFRVTPETLQAIRGGPGVDPKSVPTPASMIAFMLSNIQDVGKSVSTFTIQSQMMLSDALSSLVPSSQLLCPGSNRRPRKPHQESVCSFVFGNCPGRKAHLTNRRGTTSHPTCPCFSLLDDLDVHVLCCGMPSLK